MSYSILFTIGRMNPPTPGHFDLIERMFHLALQHHLTKIHIILSSKTDKDRNPLDPEFRRDFIFSYAIPYIKRKLIDRHEYQFEDIENMDVDILLTHEHNRSSPNDIYSTVEHLFTPLKRNEKAMFISGPESTFTFDRVVNMIRILRKNPISGTIVRTLAHIDYDTFRTIYEFYDVLPEDIELMHKKILAMRVPYMSEISTAETYITHILNGNELLAENGECCQII